MKAKVTVTRISYSTQEIEVEIPDYELVGVRLSRIIKRMGKIAMDQAANLEFSEHSADYDIENIVLL
jgi:hypothetical protein